LTSSVKIRKKKRDLTSSVNIRNNSLVGL
jgi:hypothetical protein